MARYLIAFALAVTGGLVGPVIADSIGATGLAAYGLFLAGAAIFVLPATMLTVGRGRDGGQSNRQTLAGRRH